MVRQSPPFLRLSEELFGIDFRSLALFRVAIALVILVDLFLRAGDLTLFYTDAGVLTRAALLSHNHNPALFFPYFLFGLPALVAVLFLFQAACAVGLLVGYHTRWMTFLSWFLMVSLHYRNPLLQSGGDTYLILLLFWSFFLPLDAQWTLDRPGLSLKISRRILSWGTAAILLQTLMLYGLAAASKWHQSSWQDGSAIFYVLHNDLFLTPAGKFLGQYPTLLKGITHVTLAFELLGPFFLISPIATGPLRTATILGFIFLHVGFFACLYLRLFPTVSVVGILLFLPSWFWERLSSWRPVETPRVAKSEIHTAAFEPSWGFRYGALFFLVCVLWSNLHALAPSWVRLPDAIRSMNESANLTQRWIMFSSPGPLTGWLFFRGQLAGGLSVNLLNKDASPDWRAADPERTLKNERWRRYVEHLDYSVYRSLQASFVLYACREWNETHYGTDHLNSVEIAYIEKQTSLANGRSTYSKKPVQDYVCS